MPETASRLAAGERVAACAALPPTDQTIVYQPVSGWAVAGFGIGAVFAVLVAISTIVALAQGAPMFFPFWILGMAIAGIVFSLIGQRQIQDSEGTRAGATLARLGIWLSLLSGLSYLSYYYVTGLALQSQANAFLMEKSEDGGFFPRLIEGATNPAELNAAFLLTLPPASRGARPDDELRMSQLFDDPAKDGTPGGLTQFREGPIARLFFKDLAKDAVITPLGVLEWRYENRSYKIYRAYRISNKEVEVELNVAVVSTEAETAGKDRKWFVNMRETYPNYRTMAATPTGEGIKLLRHLAKIWLNNEIVDLNQGRPYPEIKHIWISRRGTSSTCATASATTSAPFSTRPSRPAPRIASSNSTYFPVRRKSANGRWSRARSASCKTSVVPSTSQAVVRPAIS